PIMDFARNGFDPSKPSIHSNVVRKLPIPKCANVILSHESWGMRMKCDLVDEWGLSPSNKIGLESRNHVK
ncbi:UNVERIFIED_CONTAM: hypothetical protein Sindi_2657800, partial [Sesamum indicum]